MGLLTVPAVLMVVGVALMFGPLFIVVRDVYRRGSLLPASDIDRIFTIRRYLRFVMVMLLGGFLFALGFSIGCGLALVALFAPYGF